MNLEKYHLIPAIALSMMHCGDGKKSQVGTEPQLEDYAIVYNVLINEDGDDYEVFSMEVDGSDKKNITRLPGVEWTYFSNDDKVLFISDNDTCHRCFRLYETNYLGESPKRISDLLLADSWMSSRKDGDEIIVRPSQKIDSAFYVIDRKGKLLHRIDPKMPYFSDPLFVNDGRQIVFRGGLTKSKQIAGFEEAIYIVDVDGRNRKKLTHYPQNDTTSGKFGYKAGTPKLHPTEKFISFQSKQNGKYSLYGVSLDGQTQWKLTDNPQNEGWHDWSRDGNWLAIELFDDDQTQFHIGLMDWQSKAMTILTDTTYRYQQCPNFVLKKEN